MKPIPLKMLPNRVWRLYLGGRMIDEFCHSPSASDGNFPEDWLASMTEANNPSYGANPPFEGLSQVETPEGIRLLRDLIEQNPEEYLGREHVARYGNNTGFLVKLLDSCERLPIQVHPDKQAARQYFHSDYGKTEAWHILGGRDINGEPPYILLGFSKPVTRERWRAIFDAQDIAAMTDHMHKIPVEPGQTYLIEGGTPHAIGSGCFLLEIQEPTDYTLHIERTTPSGREVPDIMIHQGIGVDPVFDCFHYECLSAEEVLNRYRMVPHLDSNGQIQRLITHDRTPCFALNHIDVQKPVELRHRGSASLLAVTSGSGQLSWEDKIIHLSRGESVFVPASSQNLVLQAVGSSFSLLECLPPKL